MPISQNELELNIRKTFPNAEIIIHDLAGDQDHYSLIITDEAFNGLAIAQQHRLVKSSLKEILTSKLHALTIKTIAKKPPTTNT